MKCTIYFFSIKINGTIFILLFNIFATNSMVFINTLKSFHEGYQLVNNECLESSKYPHYYAGYVSLPPEYSSQIFPNIRLDSEKILQNFTPSFMLAYTLNGPHSCYLMPLLNIVKIPFSDDNNGTYHKRLF